MMPRVSHWSGRCLLAAIAMLLLLLAACGTETTTSGLRGAATARIATGTPPASGNPSTQPYTFPKAWQAAAGAPTNVSASVGGLAFSPSTPLTGYACDSEPVVGTPTTPTSGAAQLYVTQDGGQTWTSTNGGRFTQMPGGCTVFVNPTNANDVLLGGGTLLSGQSAPGIWRSQDGGATWHQFAAPTVAGWPSISVQKMTVLGARIVVMVYINGEGQLANDLYASDDGGATWHQFAASLPANVTNFVTLGGSIVVETDPPYVGAGAMPSPRNVAHISISRDLSATARLSSGGPPPVFFRSDNGGNTWNKVTYPGGLPVFTQAASGNTYYGVSMVAPTQGNPPTAYWSQDSGATWKALPTLQAVAANWIDTSSLGIGLTVGPDGSVFTDTLHPLNSYQGDSDAGIFMLRPTDSAPAWQPLAAGPPLSMAALPTSGGMRLVNLQPSSPTSTNCTPVYLDLP